MPLAPGTRLGSYEIAALLGEGGMGEVWRAHDRKLGRDVALKILPPQFASDPERLARFEREAKALAALNHPRIAAIYGLEAFEGQRVLVMELALGTSLADRLAPAPLPLREALAICRQIAEGVEAAHEKGILHRDLKPANIQVSDSGEVKILDFGLAKAIGSPGSEDPGLQQTLENSPTLTARLRQGFGEAGTEMGVVLGTAAYMSPEQARGRAVDTRTDIWAFGCVLYECLTGKRAFAGETVTDTLAAILEREPDWAALPAATPATVRTLLQRCLRKDQRERLRDIGDARLELADPAASGGAVVTSAVAPTAAPVARWHAALAWTLAGLLIGAAGAGIYVARRQSSPTDVPLRKFTVEFSGYQPIGYSDSPLGPVIAPNGRMVAYAQEGRLWIRELSALAPREVPDSEGGSGPFWSSDSEQVAFVAKGLLKKATVRGGSATTLCELPAGNSLGGTWSSAGVIVLAMTAPTRALLQVPGSGGAPKQLLVANPDKGEADFHAPHFLPDGRTLLFTIHPTSGYQYRVALLDGKTTRLAIPESTGIVANAFYAASGHVLFERHHDGKAVYAIPFSLETLSASGEAFLVADKAARPSVAGDGTLLYEFAKSEELVLVNRNGSVERSVGEPYDQIRHPVFSPDGSRLAFQGARDGNLDVWIHDIGRGSTIRMTSDPRSNGEPAWSPNGRELAYTSAGERSVAIWSAPSDGSDRGRVLVSTDRDVRSPAWLPDGRGFLYLSIGAKGGNDIWCRAVNGDGQSKRFLEVEGGASSPTVSPDGLFVAYVSGESGRNDVYVRPFPEGQSRWTISANGGALPRWNPNGRELFYLEGNTLMAVSVETRPGFRVGVPQKMFKGDELGIGLFSFSATQFAYDISPDGQHVVAVRRVGGAGTHFTIVQNWLAEFQAHK